MVWHWVTMNYKHLFKAHKNSHILGTGFDCSCDFESAGHPHTVYHGAVSAVMVLKMGIQASPESPMKE